MLGSASPLVLSLGIVFGVILLAVIGIFVVILFAIIFKRKSKCCLIVKVSIVSAQLNAGIHKSRTRELE